MKKILMGVLMLGSILRCYSQTLDIRPQFGHDVLWGDVSDDGRHAITAGRYSVILWDLQNGNALKEIPCRCMGVQFIKGFPYYCVAVDMLRDDGYLDSSKKVMSVMNFMTGKKMFEITQDAIKKGDNNQFLFSAPFDPQGRFEVVDSYGGSHYRTGGRIPGGIANLSISSDSRFLLVAGKHPVIWDLDRMQVVREIPLYECFMQNPGIVDAGLDLLPVLSSTLKKDAKKAAVLIGFRQFFKSRFIDDKNSILAGAPGGEVYLFSQDGELLNRYKTESRLVYDAHLFGNRVLAGTSNNWVFTGDIAADSLYRYDFEDHHRKLYGIIYEILPVPKHDCFVGSSDAGLLYIGSLSDPNQKLKIIDMPRTDISYFSLALIDDDHILVTGSGICYAFDIQTKAFEKINPLMDNDIESCCVLSDGRILLGSYKGQLGVIEPGSKSAARVFSLGYGNIRGIVEDVARDKVYVSSNDGGVRILDYHSLSLIATCYYLGDMNSIIITPDGYYAADKSVANMIMYGNGLDLYSFDRFDLIRNRPDIVRTRLGCSPEEASLLNRVYIKRLHRMGYDETDLNAAARLPETIITRFPKVNDVSVRTLTMSVQCSDRDYPIKKIMAWINGTPILGRNGLSVDGHSVTRDIELQLAAGENRIEVSCINAAGIESLRQSRIINCSPSSVVRNLYLISLGISSFQDSRFNLGYAAKDAHDVIDLFKSSSADRYDHVFSLLLEDKDVTKGALHKIKDFLGSSTRDDSIIAFYAGHGLVGQDYDYFLSTFDSDFSKPETSSIEFEDFESVFEDVLPLKKLILVDACHSGEIDKEDIQYAENSAITSGRVLFRGASLGKESDESKLLRTQFNDLRRGMGATIMASSNGLEIAVEGDEWQNGLFTWTLKKGLYNMLADSNGDGQISVSELIRYSEAEVARVSDGKQTPSVRSINPACDFVLKGQGQ